MHPTAPFFFAAVLVLTGTLPAFAEQKPAPTPPAVATQEWINQSMTAIDSVTLKSRDMEVKLWGVRPVMSSETSLDLKAIDVLESLIGNDPVKCKIISGAAPLVFAQCTSLSNEELALSLLGQGLVVVDRRQTYGSPFAMPYEQMQESARLAYRGIWNYVDKDRKKTGGLIPASMDPYIEELVPMALIVGPFGGLLIVGLTMGYWLSRMYGHQKHTAEQSRHNELVLQTRERHVLVSTLEGELQENKNKIDAFLVIYGDVLRNMKDKTETPKYQQAGDIIQKHPALSKIVFEANVGRLSLLDIGLAGQISKLYASMSKEQEYINLEPSVPLETAIALLEKVLKDAQSLLPQLNQVLHGLQEATARKWA